MSHPSGFAAIRHRVATGAALALLALATASPAGASILGSGTQLGGFTALPGYTLFEAREDPGGGVELWRTDGTAAGTFQLNPGGGDPPWIFTELLGQDDGVAYFAVVHVLGTDVWRTDGTVAGTRRLLSLGKGEVEEVRGSGWHPALGRLFFIVDPPGQPQTVLWTSDGTAAGTRSLVQFSSSATVVQLAAGPGAMLVHLQHLGQLRRDLWRSDGTPAGTYLVGNLLGKPRVSDVFPVGDRALWLAADDCTVDVHATDGKNLLPLEASVVDGQCRNRDFLDGRGHGGYVFFPAYDSDHDQELWRSDGTSEGTVRLTDRERHRIFHLGAPGVPIGDELWFSLGAGNDEEPWRTDGTPQGTARVADVCPGTCSSSPRHFTPFDGEAWFVADLEEGERSLWRSDGTPAGTEVIYAFPRYPGLGIDWLRLMPIGDRLLLVGDLGLELGEEIYRVRGTLLERLTDLPYGDAISVPSAAFEPPAAPRALFGLDDGLHGYEPWVSDGTAEGTHMLLDMQPFGTATSPPPRPVGLRVRPDGVADVRLDWQVEGAPGYTATTNGLALIEARLTVGDWYQVAVVDQRTGSAVIDGAAFGFPHSYRVRLQNAAGVGPYSDPVSITLLAKDTLDGPCVEDEFTLCFDGGRFSVTVAWRNPHGAGGQGLGFAIHEEAADRSGYFWFFRPDNVELIVKILDGEAITGQPWVFYGALSDVEYWITVVDHQERRSVTYRNPPGEVCGRGDTTPFDGPDLPAAATAAARLGSAPPLGALAFDPAPAREAGGDLGRATAAAHPEEPCVPDAGTLCLADGRFRVRVAWQDQHKGGSGTGGALPFSDRSGFFWFFREDNVELVVKVLDGTPVNGKIWFFYGALTDVGYEIEVLDTFDGHAVREYVNPPGELCGRADTRAF